MRMTKHTRAFIAVGIIVMVCCPVMAQPLPSGTMTPLPANTTNSEKPWQAHKQHWHTHEKQESWKKADGKHPTLPATARFTSLSQATAHCGATQVEWATLGNSSLYHGQGSRYFGKTKHGAYACKATLAAAGFRPGE